MRNAPHIYPVANQNRKPIVGQIFRHILRMALFLCDIAEEIRPAEQEDGRDPLGDLNRRDLSAVFDQPVIRLRNPGFFCNLVGRKAEPGPLRL